METNTEQSAKVAAVSSETTPIQTNIEHAVQAAAVSSDTTLIQTNSEHAVQAAAVSSEKKSFLLLPKLELSLDLITAITATKPFAIEPNMEFSFKVVDCETEFFLGEVGYIGADGIWNGQKLRVRNRHQSSTDISDVSEDRKLLFRLRLFNVIRFSIDLIVSALSQHGMTTPLLNGLLMYIV
jgi:hypothetical protein